MWHVACGTCGMCGTWHVVIEYVVRDTWYVARGTWYVVRGSGVPAVADKEERYAISMLCACAIVRKSSLLRAAHMR